MNHQDRHIMLTTVFLSTACIPSPCDMSIKTCFTKWIVLNVTEWIQRLSEARHESRTHKTLIPDRPRFTLLFEKKRTKNTSRYILNYSIQVLWQEALIFHICKLAIYYKSYLFVNGINLLFQSMLWMVTQFSKYRSSILLKKQRKVLEIIVLYDTHRIRESGTIQTVSFPKQKKNNFHFFLSYRNSKGPYF